MKLTHLLQPPLTIASQDEMTDILELLLIWPIATAGRSGRSQVSGLPSQVGLSSIMCSNS